MRLMVAFPWHCFYQTENFIIQTIQKVIQTLREHLPLWPVGGQEVAHEDENVVVCDSELHVRIGSKEDLPVTPKLPSEWTIMLCWNIDGSYGISLPKLSAQFHPENFKCVDNIMFNISCRTDPHLWVSIGDIAHLIKEFSKEGDDIVLQLNW